MTTGKVTPRWSLVRSLNCETNCPMLTPCWPSAGPTGGAGVAVPPGTCSLICAVTAFAIAPSLVRGPLSVVRCLLQRTTDHGQRTLYDVCSTCQYSSSTEVGRPKI